MIRLSTFLETNQRIIIPIITIITIIYYIIIFIINKKASDKVKLNTIKVILSICMIIAMIWFLASFYLKCAYGDKEADSIEGYFIALFMLSGLPFLYLIFFGNIKPPKPDKYILKQNSYEEFSSYLRARVKEYDYELNIEKENLKIYKKSIKSRNYYIIDARVEELTEDNFNELYNNEIFPVIEEDLKKVENKKYMLYVTLIISVNRITPMFNRFIEEADEDLRYHRLPVGISFGGNKMYMPSMIDGFEEPQMKKMQKEFKEIMKVSE